MSLVLQSAPHGSPPRIYRFKTLKIKPKFGSLVDFILVVAECMAGGQHIFREFGHVPNIPLLVVYVMRPWALDFDHHEMSTLLALMCAMYIQAACFCILLMIRFAVIVANVIDKPSAALAKPFDFFAMSNGNSSIDRLIDRLHSRSFRCVGFVLRIFLWFTVSQPWRFTSPRTWPALVHLPSQKHRHRCRCDIPPRSLVHKPRAWTLLWDGYDSSKIIHYTSVARSLCYQVWDRYH